ncbi:MAG: hypothetical protein JXM73_25270 [Anaerolineae bacterium]|nr:hypothetical protein [Anaerolineae bacterium]
MSSEIERIYQLYDARGRQAVADAGRRYLPDLVAHWDGGATDTVVAAIEQIVNTKHKERV